RHGAQRIGRMDLRGTFMPARGLNRIVGAIPFLGALMGSGNRAGLIGVTYQLSARRAIRKCSSTRCH
ncbi:MAG: hypothetical protein HC779_06395, partial [Phyllobacteriaceae bacterium]|nr:hypothetical protein [Phyllobacteriaceae bacterium]